MVKRVERLVALADSLRRAGPEGRTAEALAEEFEVSTRTVKRDLASPSAGGVPVWGRPGPGGGYGITERSLPPVVLTPAQALALGAAVTVAAGAPFGDSARAATRAVVHALDPSGRRRAAELSHRIWVDPGPTAPRRVMSVLEQALVDQVTVTLDYTDAGGAATRREVEPVIFAFHAGAWSLVAWCRLRAGIRWFRLARIDRASATRRPCAGHSVEEIGVPPETAHPVDIG